MSNILEMESKTQIINVEHLLKCHPAIPSRKSRQKNSPSILKGKQGTQPRFLSGTSKKRVYSSFTPFDAVRIDDFTEPENS
jgi:hypothetical protein